MQEELLQHRIRVPSTGTVNEALVSQLKILSLLKQQ